MLVESILRRASDRRCQAGSLFHRQVLGQQQFQDALALAVVGSRRGAGNDQDEFPALAAHAGRLEALPEFQRIAQPFIPPS